MPKRTSVAGSELFIVDNSEENWKVLRYLRDWYQIYPKLIFESKKENTKK